MLLLLLFLSFTILVNLVTSNPVIGGRDPIHKYPYVVLLEISELELLSECEIIERTALCGGIILKPDVVLTAAHCLMTFVGNPQIAVNAGMLDRTLMTPDHKTYVKNYLIHEEYESLEILKNRSDIGEHNDIALLWMEEYFKFNIKIAAATIIHPGFQENSKGTIVGWGVTENGKNSYSLLEGELRVLSNNYCKNYFNTLTSDKLICVISDYKNTTTCDGDSGGPFVIDNIVVGVSSFNQRTDEKDQKCDPTGPAVFTRISEYYSWIQNNIAKGSKSQQAIGMPFPVDDIDFKCIRSVVQPPTTTTIPPKKCKNKKKQKGCVIS